MTIQGVINIRERESAGISVIKEDVIKCANCSLPLLKVTKFKESKQKNNYVVGCPRCKDKSFKYVIEGKVCVSPPEGLAVAKIETEVLHDTVYNYNVEIIYERK